MSECGSCRECGEDIVVKSWDQYDASVREVCTDCWFNELDGEEREEIAKRANRSLDTDSDQ